MDENEEIKKSQLEDAERAYEAVCEAMDSFGLKYDSDDEELSVHVEVAGEDMPIDMSFFVHPDREIVRMVSPMPYRVPKERRLDMAVALTFVNTRLINGCYDLDMQTGALRFRLCESYAGSEIGMEAFKYMIAITNMTEDDYNDKLIMLNKGIITLKRFVALVTAGEKKPDDEEADE